MSEQAKWPEAWVVSPVCEPEAVYGATDISEDKARDHADTLYGVRRDDPRFTCRRVALIPVADAARMERELAEAKAAVRTMNEENWRLVNQSNASTRAAESEAAALRERVAELEGIVEPFAGQTVKLDHTMPWTLLVVQADRIRARKSEQRPEAGEAEKPERMVFRGPNLTADGGPGPIERMFLGDTDRRWIVPDADLSTRVAALEAWREASEGRGVEPREEWEGHLDDELFKSGVQMVWHRRSLIGQVRTLLAEARRRGFVGGEGKA